MSSLSQRPADPVVGESHAHKSAAGHVTGTALYTDDLVNRHPGILHAYPVQSPHAHARMARELRLRPPARAAGRNAPFPRLRI